MSNSSNGFSGTDVLKGLTFIFVLFIIIRLQHIEFIHNGGSVYTVLLGIAIIIWRAIVDYRHSSGNPYIDNMTTGYRNKSYRTSKKTNNSPTPNPFGYDPEFLFENPLMCREAILHLRKKPEEIIQERINENETLLSKYIEEGNEQKINYHLSVRPKLQAQIEEAKNTSEYGPDDLPF